MTRKKTVNIAKRLKHWWRESQFAAIKKLLDRTYVRAVIFVLILSSLLLATISVTAQIPSDRVPQNPVYLIQEAQTFYEQRQFDRSAEIWQQAAAAFAAKNDVLNQAMALSNLSLTYQQFGQWEGQNLRSPKASISSID
ncbi:MAG: hypothetical protein HC942_27530 [Microcoleus sp. SU_5_6]|nr:hypothetical protein [Microcoleus sp. SU_5_6]